MAYTNGIFYLDYDLGSDTARTTLTGVVFSNPSGTVVRGTFTAHGLITGSVITVSLTTNFNGVWKVTLVDANTFDLDTASTPLGADVTGNVIPFGGQSWSDAWKTITSGAAVARIAPSDIIRIAKSPSTTSLGQSATWTNLSRAVTLTSALTANVHLCEATWTAVSANITQATTTTAKEGTNAIQFTVAAAFTTGKMAYHTISSTDYSGYQQLSFWFRTSVAVAADTLRIVLCSDTIGDVIVDSFVIPASPGVNIFAPFTVNKAANLGSTIQSIAVYAILDPGIPVIILDNIIVSKASGSDDSLSLTSLISKNSASQGGTEGFYGIKSINGTAVQLDTGTNSLTGVGRGYSGLTESVPTHKRETIKTVIVGTSGLIVQEVMDSGTLALGNIQFQGGWTIATTIQDGETYFSGQNGFGVGLRLSSRDFITISYLNFSRYGQGVYFLSADNNTITTLSNVTNNTDGIVFSASTHNIVTTISNANNNGDIGVTFELASNNNTVTTVSNANNNGNDGFTFFTNTTNNTVTTISNANNNGDVGFSFSGSTNNTVRTLSTAGNATSIFIAYGTNYLYDALIAEATEVSGFLAFSNSRLFSQNHDQTADNHWIFTDGGTINAQTAVRQSATGIAWRFAPTSANRSSTYPLDLSIAKIAVTANNLVTVKAFMQRSSTALTMRLVCKGGQISGVSADVVSSMSAAINTWEELTITFTPTEAGVVEIKAEAFGGTANLGYVDDMTITQI